jgi:flagellar biogenesis protein FliO
MLDTFLSIGMPGPFEVMVLLGSCGLPLALIALVVWLLKRNSGPSGGQQ